MNKAARARIMMHNCSEGIWSCDKDTENLQGCQQLDSIYETEALQPLPCHKSSFNQSLRPSSLLSRQQDEDGSKIESRKCNC